MTYSILIPNQPFQENEVKVSASFLGKNKLWTAENGRYVLTRRSFIDNCPFLREINFGAYEEEPIWVWNKTYMLAVFRHFFGNGTLKHVEFDFDETDEIAEKEATIFIAHLNSSNREEADIISFSNYFSYLVNEKDMWPHYFEIDTKELCFRLYTNGCVFITCTLPNEEALILTLYRELFSLMDKRVEWKEIPVVEKEKVPHPMQKSHAVLKRLFEMAGEDVKRQMNLDDKTFNKMRSLTLETVKPYENETVYR